MGLRGIIRDLVGIYLGYEIARGALTNQFVLSSPIIASGVILLVLGIWFVLERVGLLAHTTFG